MSVFQRRTQAGGLAPASGVRAASYSAPVPLMSTGIAALDDILCGGGILAGSLLVLVPCSETGNASAAQLGAPSVRARARAAHDAQSAAAADPYTDLFLAYAAAQGLASRHVTVVIGPHTATFVGGLMGRATDDSATDETVDEESFQRMKIAWRYDKLKRVDAPFQPKTEATFCSVFDLTKRIPREELAHAHEQGLLHTGAHDHARPLDAAWTAIERGVAQCRTQAAQGHQAPALRILVRDWGAPAWRLAPTQLVPFLLRLRTLARTLSMPTTGTPIPCIVNVSLSSQLQVQDAGGANLMHRLLHVSDGAIGLSSFAASPALREAFPDSTGALRVFRTPAIGTLTNPSLRASVLRGMGANSASHAGRPEGGAGGGENNLAFKVRRKRLVIDTLHLDIEGGVSERRTKPKEDWTGSTVPSAPSTQPAPPVAAEPTPRASVEVALDSPAASTASAPASTPAPAPAPVPAPPQPLRTPFTGLRSLRERGLQARVDMASDRRQDYEF